MQVFCSTCQVAFEVAEGATRTVCMICRGPVHATGTKSLPPPSQRRSSENGAFNARIDALEPLPSREYSADQDDSGRLPFANAFKAFYARNGSAFVYWLEKVLERGVEDAYTHVAVQYRVAWARCALRHYAYCREFSVNLTKEIAAEIERGFEAIEALVSYDVLAPIKKVTVDQRFQMPRDTVEDVWSLVTSFRDGSFEGCGEEYFEQQHRKVRVALIDGRSDSLLRWLQPCLLCDLGTEADVDLMLTDLATLLTAHSRRDERDRRSAYGFSRTFSDMARSCATIANSDAVDYPNMVKEFKEARLPVPRSTPKPRAADVWRVSLDGELTLDGVTPDAPSSSSRAPAAAAPVGERELMKGVEKSLLGLVGLEDFKPQLAMDIVEFFGSRQSRGRVFWGSSGVGKTEVAQRLAGLRDGFPQLPCGAGEVRYVSGVDGKLEVKELVDGLPPFSLLFIDEADKSLDSRAGMVTASEAMQLRHAIVTHFQRKPLFWVFLGVFAQMRSGSALTDEALRATFGDELAHRLDYADWGFPDWTLPNLLKAVKGGTSGRDVDYENDAVQTLAEYCIKSGGGVRAFDNLEIAITRHLRATKQPPGTKVSLAVAGEILAKRGVRSAI
jgi:hypothetical protein